jgi:hypothetical protein
MDLIVFVLGTMTFLGSRISEDRRRHRAEGAILGLLLGPIGLVVAGLLPRRPVPLGDRRETVAPPRRTTSASIPRLPKR